MAREIGYADSQCMPIVSPRVWHTRHSRSVDGDHPDKGRRVWRIETLLSHALRWEGTIWSHRPLSGDPRLRGRVLESPAEAFSKARIFFKSAARDCVACKYIGVEKIKAQRSGVGDIWSLPP